MYKESFKACSLRYGLECDNLKQLYQDYWNYDSKSTISYTPTYLNEKILNNFLRTESAPDYDGFLISAGLNIYVIYEKTPPFKGQYPNFKYISYDDWNRQYFDLEASIVVLMDPCFSKVVIPFNPSTEIYLEDSEPLRGLARYGVCIDLESLLEMINKRITYQTKYVVQCFKNYFFNLELEVVENCILHREQAISENYFPYEKINRKIINPELAINTTDIYAARRLVSYWKSGEFPCHKFKNKIVNRINIYNQVDHLVKQSHILEKDRYGVYCLPGYVPSIYLNEIINLYGNVIATYNNQTVGIIHLGSGDYVELSEVFYPQEELPKIEKILFERKKYNHPYYIPKNDYVFEQVKFSLNHLEMVTKNSYSFPDFSINYLSN